VIIVSYDFKSDKTRSNFSKFLKKYGRRLQYSVFEIRNSKRLLNNILKEIELKYKKSFTKNDSIVVFNICGTCIKKIKRYGYAENEEKEILFFE
jgi:CRISPR-associated protein Cas2